MRWLNIGLLAACVLLSAGCGCGSACLSPGGGVDNATRAVAQGLITETDQARLLAFSPADPQLGRLVQIASSPALDDLPPLPAWSASSRQATAPGQFMQLGANTYVQSGSATVSGDSLVLPSTGASPAWGVYEIDGIRFHQGLTKLTVKISNPVFSGANRGYWVGVANYYEGRWETLALTEQGTYQRNFNASSVYKNSAGRIFIYVLAADGQGVTVDRVTVDVDDPQWAEVTVDSGPDAGWTPAIDFLLNGNPLVVYADYNSSDPMWAVADRPDGLTNQGSWVTGHLDFPPAAIQGHWLDVAVDPIWGSPVVSFINSNTGSGATNSEIGYAVFGYIGGNWQWIVRVRTTMVDVAEGTSLAYDPVAAAYRIAYCTRNLNSTAPEYDLNILDVYVGNPDDVNDDVIQNTSNFGKVFSGYTFRNPDIDINAGTGKAAVCIEGGYVIAEKPGDTDWWFPFEDTASGLIGSLAYNPMDNQLGQAFAFDDINVSWLHFVDYDGGMLGIKETVTSVPITDSEEAVGRACQMAYAPDGTPGIVYTDDDGSAVYIRYAFLDGGSWRVETVSDAPSHPDDGLDIRVDLAFDNNGVAGICYNHLNGTTCTLRVALRGV